MAPKLLGVVGALAALAALAAAQYDEQQQQMADFPDYDAQQSDASYIPKHLQSKYGKTFGRPSPSGEETDGESGPEIKSRLFSGGHDSSFRKTATKTGRVRGSSESGEAGVYNGGCKSRPPSPMNAALKCSTFSGCRATCVAGHRFPGGETQLYITCQNGEWQVEGEAFDFVPHCQPTCLPACQHNGICTGPNQCTCPDNFSGPQCQFEKRPCLNYPTLPANSRRACSSKTCTITCATGFQFPGGSTIANALCRDGVWVPSRPEWVTIPDCQAICDPPCVNGGDCLAFNVCQCPQEYTGPQCQYSMDACSSKKLLFNGGYSCSGTTDTFSCSVTCPAGVRFEHEPAPLYECTYATGRFQPWPVPQCLFDPNMQVIDGEASYSSSYSSGSSHHGYGHSAFDSQQSQISTHDLYGTKSTRRRNLTTHDDAWKTSTYQRPTLIVKEIRPAPGVCFTWGGGHYKSFDGKVISFDSDCAFTLVRDAADNTFSVSLVHKNGRRSVKIFLQDKEYGLTLDGSGVPVFVAGPRRLPIPAHMTGISADFVAHYVVATLTGVGVAVRWDAKDFISVDVSEGLWNRTAGICGRHDGHVDNDLETRTTGVVSGVQAFVASWQEQDLQESCNSSPKDKPSCPAFTPLASEADAFCGKLMNDPHFALCRAVLEPNQWYEACKWDYCSCAGNDRRKCACETMEVYMKQCARIDQKAVATWRTQETCPVQCSAGRVYLPCGPTVQRSCGSVVDVGTGSGQCEEGCFCPENTVLNGNACVQLSECPCQLRGKSFAAGASVPKDCNTCTCSGGQWQCTQVSCGSRCSAIGDPHYTTFDGRRYDFMGTCSYHLVQGDDFTIDTENVACAGTVSKTLGFAVNSHDVPSCTKSVTIHVNGKTIKLKQQGEVLVDGQEVNKLPFKVAGAYVHVVSSIFVMVDLPNGVKIWWDGVTRVYVDAPASLQGKTKGLCGTFNLNQKDDFLTPIGDIEQSTEAFANKWKTSEACENRPLAASSHPCDVNPHNKALAEKRCSKIKGSLFQDCHWSVDPEGFYQDCLYDVCSCQGKIGECMCPIFAAYGKECVRQGIRVDWRNSIRECGVHCNGGQTYQICGDSCSRSCYDLSHDPSCRKQCVEGCNCPEGHTLDDNGQCIPIGQCPCQHNGIEYLAGYKEVRPASKGLQLCTCSRAVWDCREATDEEAKQYPETESIKSACDQSQHREYTQCEPAEPITCQNMHNPPASSPAVCTAGCVCRKGYVLDSYTKECVKPSDCPCHHGARSYAEGETMQEECNTCSCIAGRWKCSERVCAGICSAWGDSHFKTFDGRIFDFHGSCDYVLVKGHLSEGESFDVSTVNIPCSSSGVACSKAVTLKVGGGAAVETITFTADKPLPPFGGLTRIAVREAGLFVFAEVFDLGLVVQWDHGTRVYVKADPKWKGKLKGLCGNYNNNEMDDFETPSGGLSEASASLFGDSWRLQSHCAESVAVTDSCAEHPHRKTWAVKQCGVLKTDVFSACHSEVPVDPYLERCVLDACACDLGGDCECLCSALAAYAHECSLRGVPVRWRSQQLCPIQCDEKCSRYSACVETCPRKTCDNQFMHKAQTQLCSEDACVEGCAVDPCLGDQVHANNTDPTCVPVASCKTVCLTIGDVVYYEGDKMAEDACHTCYCSRHKETCSGTPCTTTTTTTTTEAPATIVNNPEAAACVQGWSGWFNSHHGKGYGDQEPVPTKLQLMQFGSGYGVCAREDMSGIRCRTVDGHRSATDVGQDVTCSLDGGLTCKGKCHDFEISVLCDCSEAPKLIAQICDPSRPNTEHPLDCHLFYHCAEKIGGGLEKVEKTCGEHMFFNPTSMTCDWPATVAAIRPFCAALPVVKPTEAPRCVDGWSDWFNSTKTSAGDFELIEEFEAAGALPCARSQITDIECQYIRYSGSKSSKGGRRRGKPEFVDYKESGNVVTCSKEVGLRCENRGQKCEDYTVKLLCACHEPTPPPRKATPPPVIETTSGCPPGEAFSSCAVPCAQTCSYMTFELRRRGQCTGGAICVPGCVDLSRLVCPPGHRWRDERSCVSQRDCTCRDNNGNPVKPGAVIHESACEVCQCVDNEYMCDASACTTRPTHTQRKNESYAPIVATFPPFMTFTASESTTLPSGAHFFEDLFTTPSVETTSIFYETTPFIVVQTTATPPQECDPDMFEFLVETLDPYALTASSSLAPQYEPQNAKLKFGISPTSGGSWVPAQMNKDQYLQVDLGRVEPIYGVVVQGSPIADDYVTSYKVLVGTEPGSFSYVTDRYNQPAVFRGPIEANAPMRQLFATPTEARYVRFNPETYHGAMAMKVEVIGCGEGGTQTTPAAITTVLPDTCKDDMGLENGMMSGQQISVSSVLNDDVERFGPGQVRMGGQGWLPAVDTNQWIMFDFLEPRNLTGITTKGRKEGDRWVEAFKVKYGHDLEGWNPIVDMDFEERVFPANFDDSTPSTTMFDVPIQARYLKIIPVKWHEGVAMRCEILGCYLPYPELPPPPVTLPPPPKGPCNVCPGLHTQEIDSLFGDPKCHCPENRWWDGEECVNAPECPCFVGHLSYAVGTVFESEDCQQCSCVLGGRAECTEKKCPPCGKDLQSVKTPACGCVCKPCPTGTRLCPTSDICIDSGFWCDGIQHCVDDEAHCVSTTTTTTTQRPTTTHLKEVTSKPCPKITCPPKYRVIERKFAPIEREEQETYIPKGYGKGVKGGRKGAKGVKGRPVKLVSAVDEDECPQFECEPMPTEKRRNETLTVETFVPPPICSDPTCPEGYTLTFVKSTVAIPHEQCPRYKCDPPVLVEGSCDVIGRNFRTFDGAEYKLDVCDHTLARDQDARHDWEVAVTKNCTQVFACTNQLYVRQDEHAVVLRQDLTVEHLGYVYTVEQAAKIASFESEMDLSRSGDVIFLRSNRYAFWLTFDKQGNVKIWVEGKLSGHVEGLCGFFDHRLENDKRKPDGTIARTTVDFGHSWNRDVNNDTRCQPLRCPLPVQDRALQMCLAIRDKPFSLCSSTVPAERFISRCVESQCACLDSPDANPEACRCEALLSYVTECRAADASIDLATWRTTHNCPGACNETWLDCHRRPCELSCDNLMTEDACPVMDNVCFPGCFCPDGLVRGDKGACVKPAECRDCVCDSFGDPQYIGFDRNNFTFNGNCTYIAARDIAADDERDFQVLATNKKCEERPDATCTEAITVLYKKHSAHVKRIHETKEFVATVDGELVTSFPYACEWLLLESVPGREVTLLVPEIQLEVTFLYHNYAFVIRLPSHIYRNRTEGLCGNCNRDPSDDLKTRGDVLTSDVGEFGASWLEELPGEVGCRSEKLTECIPPPPDQDPCFAIMDADAFGKCHPVVDPVAYLSSCQEDACRAGDGAEVACRDLEAYARECLRQGICVDWRSNKLCPMTCPEDMEYRACGLGCQKTCDNFARLEADPSECPHSDVADVCVCPHGQTLLNGSCVRTDRCVPCDTLGHREGDTWHPDECTECRCLHGKEACEKTRCPDPVICLPGEKRVEVEASSDTCCVQHVCIKKPKDKVPCPEAQQLECGFGQVMKLETAANGCQQFVCQCKPVEDCESLVENEVEGTQAPLGPGWERRVNTSGCCPRFELICDEYQCPTPPECDLHKVLVHDPLGEGDCCKELRCEYPKGVCIYEFEYATEVQKEFGSPEKRVELKQPGDSWSDGACRKCTCAETNGNAAWSCENESCPLTSEHADAGTYELKETFEDGRCCPMVVRSACKVDGEVVKVGDKKEGGRCETHLCVDGVNGVTLQTNVETCATDCPMGWTYKPPASDSSTCCGRCEQTACVIEGRTRDAGESWTHDNCTTFACTEANGTFQVTVMQPTCQNLDHCGPEDEIVDDGCCKFCKPTKAPAQVNCAPTELNMLMTVDLVQETKSGHGKCANLRPIKGFKVCQGTCDSSTYYDNVFASQESSCRCCQAVTTRSVPAEMTCEDGTSYEKMVPVPTECSCESCDTRKGPEHVMKIPPPVKGPYTKTGVKGRKY